MGGGPWEAAGLVGEGVVATPATWVCGWSEMEAGGVAWRSAQGNIRSHLAGVCGREVPLRGLERGRGEAVRVVPSGKAACDAPAGPLGAVQDHDACGLQ